MGARRLSRKGFVASAAAALAGAPLARAADENRGEHAGMMEGHTGDHAAESILSATEDDLRLLIPPRPQPANKGRVRRYELTAVDKELELMRGTTFAGYAYNDSIPGPILRATQGDDLRVFFTNRSSHAHTIHFHGTHPADMDGSREPVKTGSSYIYEMTVKPWGMHLYHCHTKPLAQHLARGLYGAFIIDPPDPRPRAQELVLMMSGFDTDGDGRNDLYGFNGRPFQYELAPIQVRRSQTVRVYLANVTEYDPVVTFHLHGEFFRLYRTGTGDAYELTDAVTLSQGERCVLEIDFHHKGLYMFHAHQSRLTDNGMSGWFQVLDGDEPESNLGAIGGLYQDEFADCTPCLGQIGAKALLKY
jgi:FtsP/CotA-like multicopper oxidase with cupredoxin domain